MPWGSAPWEDGFKRITKKQGYRLGTYSDPRNEGRFTYGWFTADDNQYDKNPKHYKTQNVTTPSGRVVKVPVDDYKHFMEHNEMYAKLFDKAHNANLDVGTYIEDTFDKKDGKYTHAITSFNGVGHIKFIEYSAHRQVMQVTFTNNNAICAYFRVPSAVVGELAYLASGETEIGNDGKIRHKLGRRFWDLVRVRGTLHGGRYVFRYVQTGDASYQTGKYTEHNNTAGNAAIKDITSELNNNARSAAQKQVDRQMQESKRHQYKSEAYYAPFASYINDYGKLLETEQARQEFNNAKSLAEKNDILVKYKIVDSDWLDE